jgi:hypothetical protein
MIRILRLSLACAVVALAATVAIRAQQPQQPAAPTGPLAPEKYKDIQLLKDVPADQLDLLMRYFVAATSLQCQSCHVRDQATGVFSYEKDTRGKTTARNMIRMVQSVNANRDQFGASINCATCHQGRNQPAGLQLAVMMTPEQVAALARQTAAAPAAAGAPPQGAPPQGAPPQGAGAPPPQGAAGQPGAGRGNQGPPVDDVLNKYIEALGGRAAVEKVQSRVITGTYVNRANQTVPFTIEEKGAKFRETATLPSGAQIIGFDGQTGWILAGANAANDLEGFPLKMLTRLAELTRPLTFKDRFQNVQSTRARLVMSPGATPVDTSMIQGVPSPGVTERFYFDAETGLLLRHQITTRTPLNGSLTETFDYSMYRPVAGVMMAHSIKRNNWAILDTLTVTDIKANAVLDDSRFNKPKG